jgi:hypothetical protein
MGVSSAIAIGGLLVACVHLDAAARDRRPDGAQLRAHPQLLLNKYYVDELYDATIVHAAAAVSREGLWRGVDVA